MHFNFEFFLTVATLLSGAMYLLHRSAAGNSRWLSFAGAVGSLFGVLLLVLLIRSFAVEPFRIPSGSMLPTLEIGDFILVNKYAYGLHLPVLRYELWEVGKPERGDVAVFKYPHNPSQDFIKRVIGLPGDRIEYRGKKIYVNDAEIVQQPQNGESSNPGSRHFEEELPSGRSYDIQIYPAIAGTANDWQVPSGHYFVMGDNRDNSNDSRSWGFVSEQDLVGRAFMVWMHWNWDAGGIAFSRIGNRLEKERSP